MVSLNYSTSNTDLDQHFSTHHDQLRYLVQRRLDPRLQRRIDPCDVLQDTYLEAARRYDRYQQDRQVPEYVWLCFLTDQRIKQIHRNHFSVQSRDIRRETSSTRQDKEDCNRFENSFQAINDCLPDELMMQEELHVKLHEALSQLSDADQRILQLRFFEQMTNSEVAKQLGIESDTAYRRYTRAINRLRKQMQQEESLYAAA